MPNVATELNRTPLCGPQDRNRMLPAVEQVEGRKDNSNTQQICLYVVLAFQQQNFVCIYRKCI